MTAYFGALVQYPNDKGSVEDYREFINKVHSAGGLCSNGNRSAGTYLTNASG